MSFQEWFSIGTILWFAVGGALTGYMAHRMSAAEFETIQDAVVGDSNMNRTVASIIISIMAVILWPVTLIAIAIDHGYRSAVTSDDDEQSSIAARDDS